MTSPLSRSQQGSLSYRQTNQCERRPSLVNQLLLALSHKHSKSQRHDALRSTHKIIRFNRLRRQKSLSYPLASINNLLNLSSGLNKGIK